jgi:signal peptidase I
MKNTLVNGDSVLLLSNTFYHNPQQGDIIVASKDSFQNGKCIVKRVIATEGQIVDIDFDNRLVYVDGKPLDESYAFFRDSDLGPMVQQGVSFPLKVADGCIFVMGDNRNDSMDSRHLEIGLIDEREIMGKAIFLLWPGAGTEDYPAKFDILRIGGIG